MHNGGDFEVDVIDKRSGLLVFSVEGAKSAETFANEAGGHRWQRVPPTERRGRVHTSTVTVAVLTQPTDAQVDIKEQDIEWTAVRGSGAGGQHRNVTDSAVLIKHKPTGLEARCQSERSQHQNRASAMPVLRARVWERMQSEHDKERASDRRKQVGSGMRGDKRRTIRLQDGQVVDHITGQRWTTHNYLAGEW